MKVESFRVRGYSCRTHGIGFRQCCVKADSVVLSTKPTVVTRFLRSHFPVFLPVNYRVCFVHMTSGHKYCQPVFVDESESSEALIRMTARSFEEEERVSIHLSRLERRALEEVVQQVRARTNVRVLLGQSAKRSALAEIFGEGERPASGAGNLDRGARFVEAQYKGTWSGLR